MYLPRQLPVLWLYKHTHTEPRVCTWLLAIMYGTAMPMKGYRLSRGEPKLWCVQILVLPWMLRQLTLPYQWLGSL